MVSIDFR